VGYSGQINSFTQIFKAMIKFLIKVALFFAILIVVDKVSGYTLSYLSENSKGGYTGHYHYLVDKTNEDVLVFGSSRAIHHYNPRIISDSLGMSCYNCGQNGNGIVLFYGWWQMIKERYQPKMIIYDITTDFDLLKGEDNHKYLGWLKEAYDRKGVQDVFLSVDKTERYKMMSQMYRYNSKWHQVVADYIYPLYVVEENGFFPLKGSIDPMKVRKNVNLTQPFEFDQLKLDYLKKLVDEIGDTKLVFVVSPSIYGLNARQLEPVRELCLKKDIPFYDFSNDKKYVHNSEYFKDGSHLNAVGADEFTKELVKLLINDKNSNNTASI